MNMLEDKQLELIHKANRVIEQEGTNKLTFSDCILLNQVYNDLPASLSLSHDSLQFLRQLSIRQD